jgi:hypothetical protein
MTTPMRPVPHSVARWISRRRWLRWADALLAWALLWGGCAVVLGLERSQAAAVVAAVLVGAGVAVQPLRARWRPISAWVALRISQGLRPGDRAWYVGAHEASLVVVTARHGVRLVIARPSVQEEALSVRRTRVFLLAAEGR